MRTVMALTAGALLAFVPAGAASAAEGHVPPGKAYGNCKHSSGGGHPHSALTPERPGRGNGGLVVLGRSGTCPGQEPVSSDFEAVETVETVEDQEQAEIPDGFAK